MSPLEIDVLEARRVYKSTGAIPSGMLRSTIYRAWERSHLQGANSQALQAEKLSSLDTERLLEKKRYLLQVATPYMRMLSQAAGSDRHAVMLGDSEAIVLDVVGDKQDELAASLGIAHFISKPYDIPELLKIIESAYENFLSQSC